MPQKKPKLGQNFLIDPGARLRIVEALGDISSGTVLEIGPGRGALTDLLATRARRLIAVELDRALGPRLTEKWKHAEHVRIHQGDILQTDLGNLVNVTFGKSSATEYAPLVVVGNLPYYITSDILLHIFEHASSIARAVLMVQDEVADRIAAKPGSRDYGVLSATSQMHATIDKLFELPPDAFSPAPEVDSAVIRLQMCPRFHELQVERTDFLRFLQRCFRQKRKTLWNNLKDDANLPSSQLLTVFSAAEILPSSRAETVPIDKMARLYRMLQA